MERNFCEAVARQVSERNRLADGEEVNCLRPAGLGTDLGQFFDPGQYVQQTGFSNITATQERKLRELEVWELRWACST